MFKTLQLLKWPLKLVQLLPPTVVIITYEYFYFTVDILNGKLSIVVYITIYTFGKKMAGTPLLVELCPERWSP